MTTLTELGSASAPGPFLKAWMACIAGSFLRADLDILNALELIRSRGAGGVRRWVDDVIHNVVIITSCTKTPSHGSKLRSMSVPDKKIPLCPLALAGARGPSSGERAMTIFKGKH